MVSSLNFLNMPFSFPIMDKYTVELCATDNPTKTLGVLVDSEAYRALEITLPFPDYLKQRANVFVNFLKLDHDFMELEEIAYELQETMQTLTYTADEEMSESTNRHENAIRRCLTHEQRMDSSLHMLVNLLDEETYVTACTIEFELKTANGVEPFIIASALCLLTQPEDHHPTNLSLSIFGLSYLEGDKIVTRPFDADFAVYSDTIAQVMRGVLGPDVSVEPDASLTGLYYSVEELKNSEMLNFVYNAVGNILIYENNDKIKAAVYAYTKQYMPNFTLSDVDVGHSTSEWHISLTAFDGEDDESSTFRGTLTDEEYGELHTSPAGEGMVIVYDRLEEEMAQAVLEANSKPEEETVASEFIAFESFYQEYGINLTDLRSADSIQGEFESILETVLEEESFPIPQKSDSRRGVVVSDEDSVCVDLSVVSLPTLFFVFPYLIYSAHPAVDEEDTELTLFHDDLFGAFALTNGKIIENESLQK